MHRQPEEVALAVRRVVESAGGDVREVARVTELGIQDAAARWVGVEWWHLSDLEKLAARYGVSLMAFFAAVDSRGAATQD